MYIKIGENQYELKTKLGTIVKIETRFKLPLTAIFEKLETAGTTELVEMLAISAGKLNDASFRQEIENEWDFTDLQFSVQELLVNLMFSGTEEQIEKKLSKFPASETPKNSFREILGLPLKQVSSTENDSSELHSELE